MHFGFLRQISDLDILQLEMVIALKTPLAKNRIAFPEAFLA
jgi:hypothetical protein